MTAYNPEFFSVSEFTCKCCGKGAPARLLVFWLDLLRRAWNSPIIVNSGFRCTKHNFEVGGSTKSRHLIGCAADICPQNPKLLPEFKKLAVRFCNFSDWEVIQYPNFIHVAVPRSEAVKRWTGEAFSIQV